MSQIRNDILTGDRVIFATNRMNKPYYFSRKNTDDSKDDFDCPFCPGNEEETPKEICRCGDEKDWEVRVFKNRYPAVENEEDNGFYEEFYQGQSGFGIHEVLVDTPEHEGELSIFSSEHMFNVLKTLKSRFIELEKEDEVKYVQIFKNNGASAGASIAHSHWQIIGVSYIPMEQERILKNINKYHDEKCSCLLCDMQKQEKRAKKRIVYENNQFLVFVPYAAKFGYEMLVVPKEHVCSYGDFNEIQLEKLGEVLIEISGRIKGLRQGIGYNLCFQDKPKKNDNNMFHWYLRILPRIGTMAGFEYATGNYINPILPEDSAKIIRGIKKTKSIGT